MITYASTNIASYIVLVIILLIIGYFLFIRPVIKKKRSNKDKKQDVNDTSNED